MKYNKIISNGFLVALFTFFMAGGVTAQNFGECGYTHDEIPAPVYEGGCDYASSTWLTKYRTPGYWIPDENTPIKTILVNWVVCQKDDGTGGWIDSPEFRAEVDLMFEHINTRYGNSLPKGYSLTCEPTYTPIVDTRIRFELNEIIFIQNTNLHHATTGSQIFAYLEQNHPDYKKALNHIFTMPEQGQNFWGFYGSDNGYGQSYVMTYASMWSPYIVVWTDHIIHVCHEYGHAVGLHHTYNGEYKTIAHYDFLEDVFGLCAEPNYCVPIPPVTEVCYLRHDFFNQFPGGNFPLMSGMNPNPRYISPKQAGRMHRALSCYEKSFKVSNQHMHKYVKEDHSFLIPLTITEDETWDFALKMYQDIVIEAGNTLTISCKVKMPIDGRIIVKPGAHLIIDGGTVTSAHSELWHGIQVLGNPLLAPAIPYQGFIEIKNGAVIENSTNGVYAFKMELDQYGNWNFVSGYEGGMIHGNSNSLFLNNTVAIQLYDYNNPNNNNSGCKFEDCEFKMTDDYIGTDDPEYFVFLNDMDKVSFHRCTFINETNTDYQFYGIKSENSILLINEGVPPQIENNRFENLEYGIYATAVSSIQKINIQNTDFINNKKGVYIGGCTDPWIYSNNFYLNVPYNPSGENGYGLYLDESTGYWVENNLFERSSSVKGIKPVGIGIIVNNSGGDPNEIYLNVFNRVEFAINAQRANRDSKFPDVGLVIKCNDYNYTGADETILSSGGAKLPSWSGIARSQGAGSTSIYDMAGNLFHIPGGAPDGDYDDLNNEANSFNYYYSDNAGNYKVEPMDAQFLITVFKQEMPTSTSWTYESACPPGSTNSGGSAGDRMARMGEAQLEIDNTEAVLLALIDGGDTEALNTEVETSIPPETVAVYNELMAYSPNLSETVVESTIEKETVLPNAMVRDVMVANPHSAKSDELLEKLDERMDPMPEYMIAQILAGRSIQSLKEELESQLANSKLKKAKALKDIVNYYKEQETDQEAAFNGLVNLFQNDNAVISSYRLAWLYMEKGEYELGNGVISNIPAQFSLTEDEQAEYEGMNTIFSMLSAMNQNGTTIEELTEEEVNELHIIASGETIKSRAYARNMLLYIGELEYEEPILHPDLSKSAQLMEDYNKLMTTKAPQMLSVYPNPSTGFVILEYKLEFEANAVLGIKDVNGKTIRNIKTTQKQDQLTVTTKDLIPGVYVATLKVNGKSIESVKFTVVK